ncbi:MAG: SpoIIE family protein phosphatase [Rhodothermales bacterium]
MPFAILVVDDEPDLEVLIRQRFRKRIRAEEWTFHFAQNGFEAMEVLQNEPQIQLVLTDINMPGMDGLTLLDRLHGMDRLLKAVVVSAYGDMSNIRVAMNRGAYDFVTKPVDFDDLERTIDKGVRELLVYGEALNAQRELLGLQKELSVARRIQRAFLPADRFEHARYTVHAFLEPAREVGGDFFDYFPLGDDRLGLVVGDVSGKGVSAALFMAITRTLIQAVAMQGGAPGQMLERVNAMLYPQSLSEMFVTAVLAVIDLRDGTVTYVTAGHHAPCLVNAAGEATMLPRTQGIGLCMLRTFTYAEATVRLAPGDTFFCYTDGVTEASDPAGAFFEEARLMPSLGRQGGGEAIVASVRGALAAFTAGHPSFDDVTALAVTYRG